MVPWFISRRRVRNSSSPAPTRPSVSITSRPTGTSSTISGAPGARRSDVAVLDQRRAAARPCSAPAAGGRGGGAPRRAPAPRSAAGSSGTSARPRRGRVARDVDEMVDLGDHLDALADELVVQVVEGALVAGDDLGAEDHGVAGLELDPLVLAGGDPRQGAARLALAAGAQVEHALARQRLGLALVADRRHVLQVADARARPRSSAASSGRRRTARGPPPGAASIADSSRAMLEAKVVSTTRLGCSRDQLGQALAHLGLGARGARARARWCCRRPCASTPSRPSASRPALSVRAPDHRRRVELPVAGVQHAAERRLQDQRVGIGDRVGDVDEAAGERRRPRTPGPARRRGSAPRARSRSRRASRAARRR